MKNHQTNWAGPVAGMLLCATAASAQNMQPANGDWSNQHWDPFAGGSSRSARTVAPEQTVASEQMVASNNDSKNRVSASLRFGLNISGKFKGIGTGFNPHPENGSPMTTPHGDAYNYGDGYVYPDISGSGDGLTSYWGYDSASQVDTVNNVVGMDSTSANPSEQSSDADMNPGFEITYDRELGVKDDWHHMRYGVEGAVNYMPVSFKVNGTFTESATTYFYPFASGTTPPGYNQPSELPYQGSFEGPGFLLGSMPVGSPVTALIPGASLLVQDNFDADLWGFRLGPYVEFPLTDKFNLHVSGGLALGLLNSSATWNEKLMLSGGSVQTASGNGSDFSALCGAYISLDADYHFTPRWDVEAALQFQDLGTYNHSFGGGRGVQLDLSQSIFIEVGVSYSF